MKASQVVGLIIAGDGLASLMVNHRHPLLDSGRIFRIGIGVLLMSM